MEAIDIQGPFTSNELRDGLVQNEDEHCLEVIITRADGIREAQDAWAKLNSCLHNLGPLSPDVLEGWDRIKPWLNKQGRDVTQYLETVSPSGL